MLTPAEVPLKGATTLLALASAWTALTLGNHGHSSLDIKLEWAISFDSDLDLSFHGFTTPHLVHDTLQRLFNVAPFELVQIVVIRCNVLYLN